MHNLSDPFSVLGLPATFDLDPHVIERAYLQRATSAHPDIALLEDDDRAEQLNEARRTLLNPERRAAALLALRGGPSADAQKSLPPGFLMQFMQTREEIDEALAARDADRLRTWREWALAQRADHAARVAHLLRDPSPHNLVDVRTTLNAWRYIERLIEQLEPSQPAS